MRYFWFPLFSLAVLFANAGLKAQINNTGASIVFSSGANMVLNDMGIIQTGSGNFSGFGTVVVEGTGSVVFENSGINDLTFYQLEMNNSGGVVLNDAIDLSNNLNLIDGIIDANSADLRMGISATVTGGSNTAHIDGFVSKAGNTDFSFPIGDNGIYQYLRMTDISSVSTFRVSYTDAAHPQAGPYYDGNANASITEEIGNCDHWDVERTTGTATANVVISYGNNPCNMVPPAGEAFMSMALWDGLSWNYPLPGVDPISVSGEVATTTPLSNFGGFVLASNDPANNVLPIELLSFDARLNGERVLTLWKTASEINNDYFTVERSRDGINFFALDTVKGAGTSNSLSSYFLMDTDPLEGVSYYRLRQTDFDGSYTLSDAVSVIFEKPFDGFGIEQAFACDGGVCLRYRAGDLDLDLLIRDALGRLVHRARLIAGSGFVTVPLEVSKGVYFLSLTDGRSMESVKLFY